MPWWRPSSPARLQPLPPIVDILSFSSSVLYPGITLFLCKDLYVNKVSSLIEILSNNRNFVFWATLMFYFILHEYVLISLSYKHA